MERESYHMKFLSCLSRPGRKLLFFLVLVNLGMIWFVYFKSNNYLSFFASHSKHEAIKVADNSLYNLSVFHIPLLSSKQMIPFYIEIYSGIWCFLSGSDLKESKKRQKCICINHWFGLDCGIPESVWKSSFLQEGKNGNIEIRRRDKPRRIISSILIHDNFEPLVSSINETFSVVDIFLTAESNKESPSLMDKFHLGFLTGMQNKIMPFKLNLSVQPHDEDKNVIFIFSKLWEDAWKRVADFRPDDIFLFSHMTSILSKNVLLFLKLYDGYPEPFLFELKSYTPTVQKTVPFKPYGCTFRYISFLCEYSIIKLLNNKCSNDGESRKVYEENYWKLQEWTIGNIDAPSGWYCNNICCSDRCKHLQNSRQHTWAFENVNKSSVFRNETQSMPVQDSFSKRKSM